MSDELPGWTMQVWMPDAVEAEADALIVAIAELAMTWPTTGWDAHCSAAFSGPPLNPAGLIPPVPAHTVDQNRSTK